MNIIAKKNNNEVDPIKTKLRVLKKNPGTQPTRSVVVQLWAWAGSFFKNTNDLSYETWERIEQKPRRQPDYSRDPFLGRRF